MTTDPLAAMARCIRVDVVLTACSKFVPCLPRPFPGRAAGQFPTKHNTSPPSPRVSVRRDLRSCTPGNTGHRRSGRLVTAMRAVVLPGAAFASKQGPLLGRTRRRPLAAPAVVRSWRVSDDYAAQTDCAVCGSLLRSRVGGCCNAALFRALLRARAPSRRSSGGAAAPLQPDQTAAPHQLPASGRRPSCESVARLCDPLQRGKTTRLPRSAARRARKAKSTSC